MIRIIRSINGKIWGKELGNSSVVGSYRDYVFDID